VTRGWLPQKAGSLGLNGGGAAATVPPKTKHSYNHEQYKNLNNHARELLTYANETQAWFKGLLYHLVS